MGGNAKSHGEPATGHFSIGLLTALVSEELVPAEEVLFHAGWQSISVERALRVAGISGWRKEVGGRTIRVYSMAIGRMGQAHSAIETLGFLSRCNPSAAVLCGIAGSLNSEKYLKGDVVVGLETTWRGQNKVSDGAPCDAYRQCHHPVPQLDADFRRSIERWVANKFPRNGPAPFDVHAGEVFTWDYVVNGEAAVNRILQHTPKALCVEMEAGGFLAAIERHQKLSDHRPMHGFIIRGISDYAARKDKDGTTRRQASENAATVAVQFIEDLIADQNLNLVDRLSTALVR